MLLLFKSESESLALTESNFPKFMGILLEGLDDFDEWMWALLVASSSS